MRNPAGFKTLVRPRVAANAQPSTWPAFVIVATTADAPWVDVVTSDRLFELSPGTRAQSVLRTSPVRRQTM